MRRRAYPYGRYLIRDRTVTDLGSELKFFMEKAGYSIAKQDEENEGTGTLIVAVNKSVTELFMQKKPPGHLEMIARGLLAGFTIDISSMRDMDDTSQRIGMELYLWPVEEGVLLEMFVLPYMEHLNRSEIFGITESREEEITDWYLCERTWELLEPEIVGYFKAEPVHRRA
jgi:hypothetical protein